MGTAGTQRSAAPPDPPAATRSITSTPPNQAPNSTGGARFQPPPPHRLINYRTRRRIGVLKITAWGEGYSSRRWVVMVTATAPITEAMATANQAGLGGRSNWK